MTEPKPKLQVPVERQTRLTPNQLTELLTITEADVRRAVSSAKPNTKRFLQARSQRVRGLSN